MIMGHGTAAAQGSNYAVCLCKHPPIVHSGQPVFHSDTITSHENTQLVD